MYACTGAAVHFALQLVLRTSKVYWCIGYTIASMGLLFTEHYFLLRNDAEWRWLYLSIVIRCITLDILMIVWFDGRMDSQHIVTAECAPLSLHLLIVLPLTAAPECVTAECVTAECASLSLHLLIVLPMTEASRTLTTEGRLPCTCRKIRHTHSIWKRACTDTPGGFLLHWTAPTGLR